MTDERETGFTADLDWLERYQFLVQHSHPSDPPPNGDILPSVSEHHGP